LRSCKDLLKQAARTEREARRMWESVKDTGAVMAQHPKGRRMTYTERCDFRVTPQEKHELAMEAEATGLSQSDVIRIGIQLAKLARICGVTNEEMQTAIDEGRLESLVMSARRKYAKRRRL
jgi:hypothetical protein